MSAYQDLSTFPYWNNLNDRRQAALIDLRFCLGPNRYRQFVKMEAALNAGDYEEAADQILDSRFAQQTGHRASDLALMIQGRVRHGRRLEKELGSSEARMGRLN